MVAGAAAAKGQLTLPLATPLFTVSKTSPGRLGGVGRHSQSHGALLEGTGLGVVFERN